MIGYALGPTVVQELDELVDRADARYVRKVQPILSLSGGNELSLFSADDTNRP
jgi:hypothetical protein